MTLFLVISAFVFSGNSKAQPLHHITGLLIFRGEKSKISRDFQGQIRGKIGRFRGILEEKSQIIYERFSGANSKKNRPISQEISGRNFAKKQSVKNR